MTARPLFLSNFTSLSQRTWVQNCRKRISGRSLPELLMKEKLFFLTFFFNGSTVLNEEKKNTETDPNL